ncbi:unnamed protein product [Hymenolepis diminuta]|uniref:Uncharacterized protein n=1 Tax=Hymenolepis diminuta TaxID=6216 RepID=A0A0R3STW6_HYMDI|nr:unnamed protein product [Hymenolepis diminuta]
MLSVRLVDVDAHFTNWKERRRNMNPHIDPSGQEEIFTNADHHTAISWDALPPHEVLFEHVNPSPPPPSAVISQDAGICDVNGGTPISFFYYECHRRSPERRQ